MKESVALFICAAVVLVLTLISSRLHDIDQTLQNMSHCAEPSK